MPLYIYKCESCGFSFEITQKFSDEPLKKCTDENCDGELKKVISDTNFQLKGTGWGTDLESKRRK